MTRTNNLKTPDWGGAYSFWSDGIQITTQTAFSHECKKSDKAGIANPTMYAILLCSLQGSVCAGKANVNLLMTGIKK